MKAIRLCSRKVYLQRPCWALDVNVAAQEDKGEAMKEVKVETAPVRMNSPV